jgi:hypothetical protein
MKFILDYHENHIFSAPSSEQEFANRLKQVYTQLEYAQNKPNKQNVNSLALSLGLVVGALKSIEEVK